MIWLGRRGAFDRFARGLVQVFSWPHRPRNIRDLHVVSLHLAPSALNTTCNGGVKRRYSHRLSHMTWWPIQPSCTHRRRCSARCCRETVHHRQRPFRGVYVAFHTAHLRAETAHSANGQMHASFVRSQGVAYLYSVGASTWMRVHECICHLCRT
jgi:hypothetical protein